MSATSTSPQPRTLTRRVTLCNIRGLHARASAKFVTLAESFDAHIEVTSHNSCGEECVVADSIMELLMLGSACGEDITISASGPDAIPALDALGDLVQNAFGEGE
jgi:phosphocarrier protein